MSNIVDYIELVWSLFAYIAIPLCFGLAWRRTNRPALWSGVLSASAVFLYLNFWADARFEVTVFVPTLVCTLVTWLVSLVTRPEDDAVLNRFYCIMNTPIGQEAALVDAGIDLPAIRESRGGELNASAEMDEQKVARLYERYAADKIFGPASSIEIRMGEFGATAAPADNAQAIPSPVNGSR